MHNRERYDARLRQLLATAARRVAAVRGPIRSSFDTGLEIAQFVRQCSGGVEHGTLELIQKRELWRIFAPAGDWDHVVGDIELGNEILDLLDLLYGNELKTIAT
jgi:hypothetical protein